MPHLLSSECSPIRLDTPVPTWPLFEADEVEAAAAVLRSGQVNYWTGGEGKAFEGEYAAAVGVKHAIAAANGTVTLEMALQALGIGPGDDVIVTPRTFMASASCVVTVGARAVFADVDEDSGNISAETIAAVRTPRTKAILPVHLYGWPCEMDGIMRLAAEHGLFVIEDCAQAHGARFRGRPVGSIGHVGSFSFCQDKIISTGGEGGLLTTTDDALWSRLWSLKENGKSFDACFNRGLPPGSGGVHESFGSNHRMTEMQAAIGRVALRKLPRWTRERRRNAEILSAALRDVPCIRNPAPPAHAESGWYKFCCYVRPDVLRPGWTRDRVIDAIRDRGVPCGSGTASEVYLEAAFARRKLGPQHRLPVARELGETSLVFPVYPTITESTMTTIAAVATDVLHQASA